MDAIEKFIIEETESPAPAFRERMLYEKDTFPVISLQDVAEVLNLTIKADRTNKIIAFLCLLSTYTEDSQFNVTFNAPSSSGKSYIPLEVSKLFPKEDVKSVAHCSPTAFFHDHGALNKDSATYHLSLERKILIFLDQPHTKLLEKLRPFFSHDEKEIILKITDKTQRSGLKTKNVVIRGYPSVIFCSAGLKIDEQEATRFLLLSPEITQDKLKGGIKEALSKESDSQAYRKILENNPKRQALIERIEAIKQEGIEDIKIHEELRQYIETWFFQKYKMLNPRHQRDIKRLSCIIKSIALLNLWHREVNPRVIMVAKDDVETGIKIWDEISYSQEFNLSPYVFKIYTEVIEPLHKEKQKGLTREEILKKHINLFERPLDKWKLGREIIPMLEAAGLVTEEDDPEDRRRKLLVPIYPTTQFELKNEVINVNWDGEENINVNGIV